YGNRLSESWSSSVGPAVLTQYAYDGWSVSQDAAGNPAGYTGNENWKVWVTFDGNAVPTRYLNGDAVDQVFARLGTAGSAWYLTDRLGTVKALTDDTGAVQDRITYDAFGNVLHEAN